MTKIIYSKPIYKNGKAEIFEVLGAECIKVQGVGSGTYILKGKLSKDCAFDNICTIRANDFQKDTAISDNYVHIADISGYSIVTVEATGYTEVYATVLG